MQGWFELEDPEGAYDNDHDKPLSGRVYLKLKWHTEALLEGSMRTQVKHEKNNVVYPNSPTKNETNGKSVWCQSSHHFNGEEIGGRKGASAAAVQDGGGGSECELEQQMTLQVKRDQKNVLRSAPPPSPIHNFRSPASELALSPGKEFAAASGAGAIEEKEAVDADMKKLVEKSLLLDGLPSDAAEFFPSIASSVSPRASELRRLLEQEVQEEDKGQEQWQRVGEFSSIELPTADSKDCCGTPRDNGTDARKIAKRNLTCSNHVAEREKVCVCVCVCVRERERERER